MIPRTSSGIPSSANFSNAAGSMRNSLAKAAKVAESAAQKAAERGGKAYQAGQNLMQTAPSWPTSSRRERSASAPWLSDDSALPFGPIPEFEIRVCSWNLHASPISAADDARQWLSPSSGADIYVIGVQELVELGARSVVLGAGGDEQKQQALEARVEAVLSAVGVEFVKVCSFGMVGQAMLVYVRTHMVPYIRGMDCDRVKTGLEGLGGNKGCVCVRFMLGEFSFCFVNVHLASGQNKSFERDQHIAQILADAFQSTSSSGSSRPPKLQFKRRSQYTISSHGLSIIFGDFNSRLDMAKEEVWPQGGPDAWLQLDQLLLGQAPSLKGYREGLIGFPPTYKYKEGTDDFNRKRAPAWCDRIVFKAECAAIDVELMEYDAQCLKHTSDHRPIAAQFHITPCGEVPSSSTPLSLPPTSTTDPWTTNSTAFQPASAYEASSSFPAQNFRESTLLDEAPPVIALPDTMSPVAVAPSIIALPPSASEDPSLLETAQTDNFVASEMRADPWTVQQSADTPWPESSPWPQQCSESMSATPDPWSPWPSSTIADSSAVHTQHDSQLATSMVNGSTPWDVGDSFTAKPMAVIDDAWPLQRSTPTGWPQAPHEV